MPARKRDPAPAESGSNVVPGMGRRMKKARSAVGLSGDECAEKLSVERSTYYSWESGVRSPNARDVPRIAALLKTSVGFLYGERTS